MPRVVASAPRVLVTEWVDGTPLAKVISDGTEAERDEAGRLMATLHFSAPARAGLLHADPHPGNFRILPDGRLGVIDFGAVARLPGGHPEPIGRLVRLALDGDAQGVVDGLRDEGFIKPDDEIDAEAVLEFLRPMLEPIAVDEFRFTRAWLRGEATRLSQPASPGLPARPQAQPAAVVPADPPGDARLDRRAVPARGEGAVPRDPAEVAARLRTRAMRPSTAGARPQDLRAGSATSIY